jgi:hypothetical protein
MKCIVQGLSLLVVVLIVVVGLVVGLVIVIDDSGVIVDNITLISHRWAVLAVINGNDRRGGGSRGTHLVCL